MPDIQVDLPALWLRATFTPASVNNEDRTIELILSTGAPVERVDWWTGKRYIEKLSMDPSHIRLGRLNAGAPLLDTHSSYSVRDQLGVILPGTAEVKGKQLRAVAKFSQRDDVTPIWNDVRGGIVRNVSVGYKVHAYQEVQGKGDAPSVRTAIDWEPYEGSMVPMPADTGAQTRASRPSVELNPCRIITRDEEVTDADRLRRFRLAQLRAL